MSVLCLYLCVCMSVANIGPYIKTRSSYPITFYYARRQQSSRTVELVDHTYNGRRVARHTSLDRNAVTALLRSRMGLLCILFLQWCSRWQDFVWYSVSVQKKCADARTTRSLVVIKVDCSTSQYCTSVYSAVSSIFLKTLFGEKLMVVVLFCCCLFFKILLSQ